MKNWWHHVSLCVLYWFGGGGGGIILISQANQMKIQSCWRDSEFTRSGGVDLKKKKQKKQARMVREQVRVQYEVMLFVQSHDA